MGPQPHTAQSNIVKDNPRKFMALALGVAYGDAGEPLSMLLAVVLFFYSFLAWLECGSA
jgi:hypothetical protein